MAASDRVRLGIIGVGDRGQQDLHSAIRLPGVECVAAAGIYSHRRDQAGGVVPNSTINDDPRCLFDRKDIDAVGVPLPLHGD